MVKLVRLFLIVAANPKAYSSEEGMAAGESAGIVEAFVYYLKNPNNFKGIQPGVFYSAGIKDVGLIYYLPKSEARTELLRNFGVPVQVNGQKITIDKTGYFYQPEKEGIYYQFEADGLRTLGEIRKDSRILQRYLIEQHKKVALDPKETDWSEGKLEWLLIRKIEKLKKPIGTENSRLAPFLVKTESEEEHILYAISVRPNAYARLVGKLPRSTKITQKDMRDLESEMLAEILSSKKKKLAEVTVHNIFKQQILKKGLHLVDEGHTKKGRFDLAYENETGILVVIEFKVGIAGDDTLDQLKGYMCSKFRGWGKKKKGIIIARSCEPSTEKKIKQLNIQFIPYKLTLNFPGLFDETKNNPSRRGR